MKTYGFDRHHHYNPLENAPVWAIELHAMLEHSLKQGTKIMSTLADAQAAQAITDQKIAAISTDVQTLLAKIAAIPTGGLTADQQAAVDDIAAHAGRINDALSAVDTAANPPAAATTAAVDSAPAAVASTPKT